MKKNYILGLALFTALFSSAQDTITFEATALNTDSFNNGSDLSGGFTYGDVHFSNFYDTNYMFNTGFAISNQTDVTTAGYTNPFSSFAGGGHNSSNFAVYYPEGITTFGTNRILESVRITNNTYAALSMRDGDAYGKKFGSLTNAAGVNDSTNGEDFFLLNIASYGTDGVMINSVDVYLADFRFADNTQDYILDTWLEVDLSSLNPVGSGVHELRYTLTSSDVGSFGMNTPAYFAMDDLISTATYVGIDELSAGFDVYPNPVKDELFLKEAFGTLRVSDGMGKLVYVNEVSGSTKIDFRNLISGIYFVTLENENGIFTKKIIK